MEASVCTSSFFFFKQKTAYEITEGDWSSDVCSSDLALETLALARGTFAVGGERGADRLHVHRAHQLADVLALARRPRAAGDVARRADRLPQSLRQLQRLELRLAQAHQRLAQVLGGVSRALARALAGRSRGLVGIFAVVRCGGHGRLVAALTAAVPGGELQFKPNAHTNHAPCNHRPHPRQPGNSPTSPVSCSRKRAAGARRSAKPTPRSPRGCR